MFLCKTDFLCLDYVFVKHMVHIVSNIHLAIPKISSWGRDAIKCCLPSVFKIDSQIWSDTFRTCVIISHDFDISSCMHI